MRAQGISYQRDCYTMRNKKEKRQGMTSKQFMAFKRKWGPYFADPVLVKERQEGRFRLYAAISKVQAMLDAERTCQEIAIAFGVGEDDIANFVKANFYHEHYKRLKPRGWWVPTPKQPSLPVVVEIEKAGKLKKDRDLDHVQIMLKNRWSYERIAKEYGVSEKAVAAFVIANFYSDSFVPKQRRKRT